MRKVSNKYITITVQLTKTQKKIVDKKRAQLAKKLKTRVPLSVYVRGKICPDSLIA